MSEKEYIERGAFIDFIDAGHLRYATEKVFSENDLVKMISKQPAADVEPVVHGEWLNFVGDYVTAECSVCGECYDPSDYNDKEHFDMFKQLCKYCPNCGAKMDRVIYVLLK